MEYTIITKNINFIHFVKMALVILSLYAEY